MEDNGLEPMTFWLPACRKRFCKSFDTLDLRSSQKSRSLIRSLSPGRHQPYTKRDAGQCSLWFSPALGLFSMAIFNFMLSLDLCQRFLWVTAGTRWLPTNLKVLREWFFFFKLSKVEMFCVLGLRWWDRRTSVSGFALLHAAKMRGNFHRFEGLTPRFSGVEQPLDYHTGFDSAVFASVKGLGQEQYQKISWFHWIKWRPILWI